MSAKYAHTGKGDTTTGKPVDVEEPELCEAKRGDEGDPNDSRTTPTLEEDKALCDAKRSGGGPEVERGAEWASAGEEIEEKPEPEVVEKPVDTPGEPCNSPPGAQDERGVRGASGLTPHEEAQLVQRAIREGWPIEVEGRGEVVREMRAILTSRSSREKDRIAAAKVLLQADAQNLERVKLVTRPAEGPDGLQTGQRRLTLVIEEREGARPTDALRGAAALLRKGYHR